MRIVGVVTTSRADYGIYRPLLKKVQASSDLCLRLYVSGMHLLSEFGNTVQDIEDDGFEIAARVDTLLRLDTPSGVAQSMGHTTAGFARALEENRPDILVVLGDRFEMHAAAVAAVPYLLPIAHIAGGCVTAGAIDDSFRHSLTKLCHLHFAETTEYARRITQMGEEAWRVTVTGALALDGIDQLRGLTWAELARRFSLPGTEPPLVVTFHPVTRHIADTKLHVESLLAALDRFAAPLIFTAPNADTNGRMIADRFAAYVNTRPNAALVPNFGNEGYFNLMRHARAIIGNSSSGIVEAPSFRLPVVNIGDRQEGRITAANVINVGCTVSEIETGIRRAVSPEFRAGLEGLENPYGDGGAADRMLAVLRGVDLDSRLITKRFQDL